MKRAAVVLLLLAQMQAGCVATPSPRWQADAQVALDRYGQAWLEGRTRVAEHYFAEARSAVAGTGRPDLVARVELVRCAMAVAALEYEMCRAVEPLRADLSAADGVYAQFLDGAFENLDASRLPAQYAGVTRANGAGAQNKALQDLEDPVSRLVAAGALFRAARLSPQGIGIAVDTASAQAWRRPLLAYLNVQAKLAEAGGDAAALEAVRKRIELVSTTERKPD